MDRSLKEQILCEKMSPQQPKPREPLDDSDYLSRTTRLWLQRLGCDAGAVHKRQAFLESLWAGYRTGALALRKSFTAWCALAFWPNVQSETLREHGLAHMYQTFDYCHRHSPFAEKLPVTKSTLHTWAQVVFQVRYFRTESLNLAVSMCSLKNITFRTVLVQPHPTLIS